MKYIVTQKEDGKEEIFLFPQAVNHAAMAEALIGLKNQTFGEWHRKIRHSSRIAFAN